MILRNLLDYVDDIKPNAFTNETKTAWVNEVEGMVQTEVMLLAIEDVVTYTYAEHANTELFAKPPHDKIYGAYLCAMIDFANGEYNKYSNTMQMFNAYYGEYMRWYAQRYRPADEVAVFKGYYLSAFSLALKHGFVGTEDEWLASLKGDKGEPGESFKVLGKYDTLAALQSAVTSPNIGDNYYVGTSTPYDIYAYTINGWLNIGPLKGEDGADGEDGVSPIITVTPITGGNRVTITDANGTKTMNVMDGTDGKDGSDGRDGTNGKDGANGKDGVSATHSWNGTTLTITSASGTSSANLKGDKGEQGIQGLQGEKGEQGIQGEKGEKGEKGDSYTLTDADRTDIAEEIADRMMYIQNNEPLDALENSIWIDTYAEAEYLSRAEGVGF